MDLCLVFTLLSIPQIFLSIEIQLSYINTNHEDFIGFAK